MNRSGLKDGLADSGGGLSRCEGNSRRDSRRGRYNSHSRTGRSTSSGAVGRSTGLSSTSGRWDSPGPATFGHLGQQRKKNRLTEGRNNNKTKEM